MKRIVRTETKVCKKCGEEKRLGQFYTKGDGSWTTNCKPCHNDLRRVYREQNRDSINEEKRAEYQKHRDRYLAYFASDKRKEKWFAWKLDRQYGISVEQYLEMLAKQDGRCAICRKSPDDVNGHHHKHRLHVDHCHTTERVRGLLCHLCNAAIGMLRDSPDLLRAAIEYLQPPKQEIQ